jgi:hypothetical protein
MVLNGRKISIDFQALGGFIYYLSGGGLNE